MLASISRKWAGATRHSRIAVTQISCLVVLIPGISKARIGELGFATSSTPYDPFMHSVKWVLGRLDGREHDFSRVQELQEVGRRFRYHFSEPYEAASPEETAERKAGDCKDKSLWLVAQLNDISVRYVVGKLTVDSRMMHAWVAWNDGNHWWLLDPTLEKSPLRADQIRSNRYIPYYSFGKSGSRRHVPAQKRERKRKPDRGIDWRIFQ